MNNHLKTAASISMIGMVLIIVIFLITSLINDAEQTDTSDARDTKGKVIIGYDNWVGYFPLCSPEMRKRLRQSGYILECIDDGADYKKRFSALDAGDLNFAVGTVDSYVLNGEAVNYPGVIVAAIDESKGGDAIVAWEDKLVSLEGLKNKSDLRIAFTPDSPSDHFLKAISVHFDIPHLRTRKGWPVEAEGSSDALKIFLNKDAEAAVLWQPDVAKALSKQGVKRIIGTEDTNQLVVDVLLTGRRYSSDNPEMVETVLHHYFKTLKYYRENPEQLIEDIAEKENLDKYEVNVLLDGIKWATLTDNAQRWFGSASTSLPEEALIETIESTIKILIGYGDIDKSPIPNNDPYRITNSRYVRTLYEKMMSGKTFNQPGAEVVDVRENSLNKTFSAMDERDWNNLLDIGTLKIHPIVFSSGSSDLTLSVKGQLDKAVENLMHYPNYRLEIRGHTGVRGDKAQNKILSTERADSVLRYISITYSIDQNRMRAVGFGGGKPLARKHREPNRSYNYRLSRVELVLVTEEF